MERGFIKLYRSIDQNELLENDNTALIVFIKLLTRVDRRTGSYRTGRFKLANQCNLRPSTLRDALKRLEAATVIRQQSDSRATTIYICNWSKYQQNDDSTPSVQRRFDDTKQEREREREYSISKPRLEKSKKTDGRDVLAILNSVTGRNFKVEPKGIEKTKQQFTDEEIERALKNMYKDEWHKSRMSELKSDYLLRSTTIDNFKDYSPKSKYLSGDPTTLTSKVVDRRSKSSEGLEKLRKVVKSFK